MLLVSGIRTGRHVVYSLTVHLVFITKYRRDVFTPALHAVVGGTAASVCRDFEADLLEYGGEDDHAHLLVSYPPKVAVSRLVNSLEGVTARRVRSEHGALVREKLWGRSLWSPSYCAISTGGAALETGRTARSNAKRTTAELDPSLKEGVCAPQLINERSRTECHPDFGTSSILSSQPTALA